MHTIDDETKALIECALVDAQMVVAEARAQPVEGTPAGKVQADWLRACDESIAKARAAMAAVSA